jgi:hypothetical protein
LSCTSSGSTRRRAYSEWSDPSGQNWWNTTSVRRAPDHNPTQVSLEYRRGNGEWVSIPCTIDAIGAHCQVTLPVEEEVAVDH